MLVQLLRTKIQQLIVTESSESYPGSIALPDDLIEAAGLHLFELVHVNNLNNGSRIITYVIRSNRPGVVTVNGAASKHFSAGDKIHVLAFSMMEAAEASAFVPRIVYADGNNQLVEIKEYAG